MHISPANYVMLLLPDFRASYANSITLTTPNSRYFTATIFLRALVVKLEKVDQLEGVRLYDKMAETRQIAQLLQIIKTLCTL